MRYNHPKIPASMRKARKAVAGLLLDSTPRFGWDTGRMPASTVCAVARDERGVPQWVKTKAGWVDPFSLTKAIPSVAVELERLPAMPLGVEAQETAYSRLAIPMSAWRGMNNTTRDKVVKAVGTPQLPEEGEARALFGPFERCGSSYLLVVSLCANEGVVPREEAA